MLNAVKMRSALVRCHGDLCRRRKWNASARAKPIDKASSDSVPKLNRWCRPTSKASTTGRRICGWKEEKEVEGDVEDEI